MQLTRMLTLEPDSEGMPNAKWFKQMIIDPGSKRYPYIWDTITNGCDETEMRLAINMTAEMIWDAGQLLQSIRFE